MENTQVKLLSGREKRRLAHFGTHAQQLTPVVAAGVVGAMAMGVPAFATTVYTTEIVAMVTELTTLATAVIALVLTIKGVAWGLSVLRTAAHGKT